MIENKKKYCDVGQHEVEKLWHSRRKDRPSCCQSCLKREPIRHADPKVDTKVTEGKIVSQNEAKSLPDLLKLATIVFNKWIRERDSLHRYFTCISCFQIKPKDEMQAGHYMPSTYSSLRFNEHNVNGECETCNCHDMNHLLGYRWNLIRKIGLEAVLELEATPIAKYHKWEREELLEIIKKYKI